MRAAKKGKRFIYNLAAVLKVREIHEKRQQELLQRARLAVEEAEQLIALSRKAVDAAKQIYQEEYIAFRELMGVGAIPGLGEINRHKAYTDRLQVIIDEKKTKLLQAKKAKSKAEQHAEKERIKLVACVTDRKILDKDKEKKHLAWKREITKAANLFLDDIASIGFNKKRRE